MKLQFKAIKKFKNRVKYGILPVEKLKKMENNIDELLDEVNEKIKEIE